MIALKSVSKETIYIDPAKIVFFYDMNTFCSAFLLGGTYVSLDIKAEDLASMIRKHKT